MLDHKVRSILKEFETDAPITDHAKKHTRLTLGASVIFAITVLGMKIDYQRAFMGLYDRIRATEEKIEAVEAPESFRIVPACYDSVAVNVYEVRPCSQNEIK